jgi:L-aminopeptidase/D-esterase-like protein
VNNSRPLIAGSVTDVDGVLVGHHQRTGRGWRTGTTVILFPQGATCGVDVRGGGPGTRETDLLRPENLVEQVHGICLSGGSAYGLAAADGVMRFLEEQGVGFPVGPEPEQIVPIVPAAVIFDLGRGGRFANRPTADFGYAAASKAKPRHPAIGSVGAGTGARAGGLQGGVGSASCTLANGVTVSAIAVVNAVGSVINPRTALPWDVAGFKLAKPNRDERNQLALLTRPDTTQPAPLNTTIGVVVTDAALTKAECYKVASVAHDGLARSIRPAHTLFDGDTIFAAATGSRHLSEDATSTFHSRSSRAAQLSELAEAGAECFAAACVGAILSAESRDSSIAFRDVCPSAFGR